MTDSRFAVYLIPHSMNGSELDVETGEVVTGSMLFLAGIKQYLLPKGRR